jgi:hypothetical protein
MIVMKRVTLHRTFARVEVLRNVLGIVHEFDALVVTYPNGWSVIDKVGLLRVECEDERG